MMNHIKLQSQWMSLRELAIVLVVACTSLAAPIDASFDLDVISSDCLEPP